MSILTISGSNSRVTFDATARGQGYYKVMVNDIKVSQHTQEREAFERCTEILLLDSTAKVYYIHDYIVDIVLTGIPPEPIPVTTTTTTMATSSGVTTGSVTPIPNIDPSGSFDFFEFIDSLLPKPTIEEMYVIQTDSWGLAQDLFIKRSQETWLIKPLRYSTDGLKTHKLVGFGWKGILVLWKDAKIRFLIQPI